VTSDFIVAGTGNAALTAAISAAEHGARVLVVEKAPPDHAGGNSRFAGGVFRAAYNSFDDLRRVVPTLTEADYQRLSTGSYSEQQFFDDIMRLTHRFADVALTRTYIAASLETLAWMSSHGVEFVLGGTDEYGKTNPGAAIWVGGEGRTLVRRLTERARQLGVTFVYENQARSLVENDGRVTGVVCRTPQGLVEHCGTSVVLACGGFEASPDLRARYLGPGWDLVKVRGTRFNTGDLLPSLEEIGAQMVGAWSACHASPMDANAPEVGEIERTHQASRHDYSYGVMVNAHGERFIDEGENFRLFTYAKTGRAILAQPENQAYQLFDARVSNRLDYRYREGEFHTSDSIEGLAAQLDMDARALVRTLREYNEATTGDPANFEKLDGLATTNLSPPKSNWAQPLDKPPFLAFPVKCGITFTYGGVKTDADARVLDRVDRPIPGLFAVGEIQGGLFAHNYPGGAGLMRGAVFGRIAGRLAAQSA
jgi:tricarballylate dehydrogenase